MRGEIFSGVRRAHFRSIEGTASGEPWQVLESTCQLEQALRAVAGDWASAIAGGAAISSSEIGSDLFMRTFAALRGCAMTCGSAKQICEITCRRRGESTLLYAARFAAPRNVR